METIRNIIETPSTSHGETFDISARENANPGDHLKPAHNKKTREPQPASCAHKSQFLIVDEEWW